MYLWWCSGRVFKVSSWSCCGNICLSGKDFGNVTIVKIHINQDRTCADMLMSLVCQLLPRSLLKYGFCKKLLLYECNSDQLPISFIKIRFSCNQKIGETFTQTKKKCSPMFWLQENLIWMKEVGNWTEVHTYWNYLLQN